MIPGSLWPFWRKVFNKNQRIKEILKNNPLVEFAYLFGSRAKGLAGEKSDWDIAIYFRKAPDKLPAWTTFYLEAEITREIGAETQIVALNNLDSPVFMFQIVNDGVLLIENNTKKRLLYETRVLGKYYDWQYYLKRHSNYRKESINLQKTFSRLIAVPGEGPLSFQNPCD